MLRARNRTRETMLADEVEVADPSWRRMKGLLGRRSLETGRALWIRPCRSIHTFFMRFPIDAVFVSDDLRVVRTYRSLRPFRVTPPLFRADSVLELPAGTLERVSAEIGDQLALEGDR
jgi:uncharacterized protein